MKWSATEGVSLGEGIWVGYCHPMAEKAYDPRDVFQRPHKPETWRLTNNPVLIRAAKAKGPKTSEYWRRIAVLAEIHDATQAGLRPL